MKKGVLGMVADIPGTSGICHKERETEKVGEKKLHDYLPVEETFPAEWFHYHYHRIRPPQPPSAWALLYFHAVDKTVYTRWR